MIQAALRELRHREAPMIDSRVDSVAPTVRSVAAVTASELVCWFVDYPSAQAAELSLSVAR